MHDLSCCSKAGVSSILGSRKHHMSHVTLFPLVQRKRKEGISQFLSMMNESSPPITSQSRWKDVSRRFMKDSRFSALSESVRVSIFNQYINELAGSEKAAEEAGLALFKASYRPPTLPPMSSIFEACDAWPSFWPLSSR